MSFAHSLLTLNSNGWQRHGRTLYVVPIRMCMLMRRRRGRRCPLSVPPSVVEYMPRLRSGDGGGGLIKGIKNHN